MSDSDGSGCLSFIFIAIGAILLIFLALILLVVNTVYDFLFHSRWGLAAIISLTLSLIFAYASKKTKDDAVLKDKLMPFLKDTVVSLDAAYTGSTDFKKLKTSNTVQNYQLSNMYDWESKEELEMKRQSLTKNDESVIDLSAVNLQGLLMQMASTINKPAPWLFKKRGITTLELDIKRVNLFVDYIKSLRSVGNEFLQLKADAIFAPEKVENFLTKSRLENKNEIDILTAEAKNLLSKYSHEEKTRELDIRLREAEIKRVETVTNLAVKATERLDKLSSPDLATVLEVIINPDKTPQESNVDDPDVKEYNLLLKKQEILAKEIENKKADIEHKSMKDKYNQNKQ